MSRKHLTFANVASATALVVALGGGGVALAAGLAKNSVGSPQVKPNSLKSSDIKDATLKGVRSAKSADRAKAVDTVVVKKVLAQPGETRTLHAFDTLVVELICIDEGNGSIRAEVQLRTTADDAFMDANDFGDEFSDFDVASGPAEIVSDSSSSEVDGEDGGFGAMTGGGRVPGEHAIALARVGGGTGCLGGGTFVG
jgi:hypothetical protein